MRGLGKGVMSATTQVKVLSPEIFLFAQGQGLHVLEASIDMHAIGECIVGVPGSKSVAGIRTVYIGTWENRSVPYGSCRGVEKATKQYGVSVVGPTHSRGVAGVMSGESCSIGTLEGVGGLTQRGDF
jgi:hypothetical protein